MLRCVLDTNVIVSALLFPTSTPRQTVDKALERGKILVSQEIAIELTQVLGRKKLNKYLLEEDRMTFLADFLKLAEAVVIDRHFDVCRDKKDNKLIDLAICGNARYLITGDEDLLILNPFNGVNIVKPKYFLEIEL